MEKTTEGSAETNLRKGTSPSGKLSLRQKIALLYVAMEIVVLLMAAIKWPGVEVNYRNSDATWHTLLTLQCYDETPASVHKFLPLVSLGEERDKGIRWGATVPDKAGNYYYTSFSPMGYVLPYLFMKVINRGFSERKLFVFNTLLLMLSCAIILRLLQERFRKNFNIPVTFCIMLLYILSPEIMHGMGITYWHQSLMQVFLPLQILCYYRFITGRGKKSLYVFLALCLVTPYTEWTGYVANAGFGIAEIVRCHKKPFREYRVLIWIAVLTILSGALFCLHYLLAVEPKAFLEALKARFLARDMKAGATLTQLATGYWTSFTALILLTFSFFLCAAYNDNGTDKRMDQADMLLFFVAFFPLLENILMREHAVEYSYDRMKLALPLMLVLNWSISRLGYRKIKLCCSVLVLVAVPLCARYKTDTSYVWSVDYRGNNQKLCEFIWSSYDDSVCGLDNAVRGYANLSLGRGIYEGISEPEQLEKTAKNQNVRYLVLLKALYADGKDSWNMYRLGAHVYDREEGELYEISAEDGIVSRELIEADDIHLANQTDLNWTNGLNDRDKTLLLFNNEYLTYLKLMKAEKILCRGQEFNIISVDYDGDWIRVHVDQKADVCKYPATIEIQ